VRGGIDWTLVHGGKNSQVGPRVKKKPQNKAKTSTREQHMVEYATLMLHWKTIKFSGYLIELRDSEYKQKITIMMFT
jgi:hypothetical protein